MAVTLPNFADLGVVNPQPATAQPVYPQESPQAQSEAVLGKGIEAAGNAASDADLYQQLAKDKLEEANATVDLFSRVDPLRAQIAKETDPAKVADLKQQANDLLATSGQAIANPLRRQMWTATHTRTVSALGIEADTRNTTLGREQSVADIHAGADKAVRTAVGSDDPQAIDIAQQAIKDYGEYGAGYGALTPEQRYTFEKQQQRQLYIGKADRLIEQGRPDQASQLLDAHREDIDPVSLERLQLRIAGKANKITTDGAALRALGLPTTGLNVPVGSLPSGTAVPNLSVGGAVPQRIADEAQTQGVDPRLALTTAQIESSMGRNLGSRGNIFQLGKPEWASVGGGQMGEPETDIKNGVAFLARTQQQLEAALGRTPSPAETYLAHQQGVGGATKLLANPDTPAGQLVPPQNISANGGDPNAPASAFVGRINGIFQRVSSNIAPPGPGEGIPSADQQIPAPGQLGATTAAQPQPAQSRSGLPSLTDAYMRILRDPAIKTDEQVRQAFGTATTIHNAMEADAARTERLQIAQQHQVLEQRTNQIWADVYSGTPKITASQIAVDPAFNGNPERRKAMIELINNPPGSGVPAAQSYLAAQNLVDRIRLPYGDPNKITTPDEVYANIRNLNRPDLEFTLKTLNDSVSPGREKLNAREKAFLDDVRPQIDKSGIMPGLPNDGKGRLKFYEFQNALSAKIDQYLGAKKDPNDLLDPSKPDYMGKDEALKPFKRSMTEALADFSAEMNVGGANAEKPAVSALEITATGPDGSKIALRNGQWVDMKSGQPLPPANVAPPVR